MMARCLNARNERRNTHTLLCLLEREKAVAETAAEDGGVNKRHVLALFRNYPHLSVANTLFYRYLGILMPRRSNAAFQYRCKRGFIFITHRPLGLA